MDDPTWLDYAGFVFNVLATAAGLFGLFLAIKAYKVGVKAYEVSAESYRIAKEQGRKTFEIDTLREMSGNLAALISARNQAKEDERKISLTPDAVTRLLMFDATELPVWNFLARHPTLDQVEELLLSHPATADHLRAKKERHNYGKRHLESALFLVLHEEIYQALGRRAERAA